MARLKDYYKQDVAPALMKKFSYKSVMQIPKLDKIVINVGAGEAEGQREGDRRHYDGYCPPLPARSPRSARRKSPLRTLSSVKA